MYNPQGLRVGDSTMQDVVNQDDENSKKKKKIATA